MTRKAHEFLRTIEQTAGGTLILCGACGSAAVDHVAHDRIRCSSCEREAPIDGFKLVRARFLESDLVAALRERRAA